MVVVDLAHRIVGGVQDPTVVAVPDRVLHAVIGGLGLGLEAFLVQHVVEIGVPNFGDQVAVGIKVLVDDHNVILDFLGSFFHLVLDGEHMVVVGHSNHSVSGAINPGFLDFANHIFHAVIGGLGHGLEAFLVQHMVEIGVLDLGNQVAVGVKVLVDNHGVVLDFRGFRFLLVLEGDDIIVMLAQILVDGVVDPLGGGVAPSLKGHSAVFVDTVGIRHKAFLVGHMAEIVVNPGIQIAVGIVVLVLDHDILVVFFLGVDNSLQRIAVRLGNLAVGDLERNGLQSLIAVHLGLGQGVVEAGGDALDGHVAVGVRHAGQAGVGNREAGAGQSVAVLVHLPEAQRAQIALNGGNVEVQGLGGIRNLGGIVHLGEEVVGKGSSAVGGIRLPSLKALRRRVQGDGVGQSIGVSSSVACFGNFRRTALQVPAKDTVCIGEAVVICRRVRSRTGVLDEPAHGVRDLPGLRAQLDQLGDVLKAHGQLVRVLGAEALVREGVHPVGNILLLTGPAAVYIVVPMIEIHTNSVFRRLCLEIPESLASRLESNGVQIDFVIPDRTGNRLHRLPIFGISLVTAAPNAFHLCGAVSGALVHMVSGATVGQQDHVDVLAVLQKVALSRIDQVVGQLETGFHVGAAASFQAFNSILKIGSALSQIGPANDGFRIIGKLHQSRIALIGGLGVLDVLVHEALGGLFGRSQAIPVHTAGGVHYQDHRRIRRSGDLLQLLSRGHLQGNLKFVFRAGFPNSLADRYVVFIGFRKTVGHDLTGGRYRLFDSRSNDRTGEYAAGENRCTEDASNRFA